MKGKVGSDAAGGRLVKVLIEFPVALRIVEDSIVVAGIELLVSALANVVLIVDLPIVSIDVEGSSTSPNSRSSSESPRTNKLDSF